MIWQDIVIMIACCGFGLRHLNGTTLVSLCDEGEIQQSMGW